MSTATVDSSVAKSRRRQAPKATRGPVNKSVKIGLYLSPESARRLGITSTMESRDRSTIVDELIALHLRRYVVHTRGEASDTSPIGESAAVG